MLQVNETGIAIDRLDTIHQRLVNEFKNIYGQDINIKPESPDGQMIGIFSQALADINEVLAFMVRMLDPYQASGEWLEQRALYAGILRKRAQYSYIKDAAAIGKKGTIIPKDIEFKDQHNQIWINTQESVLNEQGSARINLRSKQLGAFELFKNNEIETKIFINGLDKITLLHDSEVGAEEETDGQLLLRFMSSHSINNHDDRMGLEAYLNSVPDVRQAVVLENFTSEYDSEQNVPAHSLCAVVLGGKDEDIATAILKKKIGGCGLSGQISVNVDHQGVVRPVKFDRAKEKNISVSIIAQREKTFIDINVTEIKNNLSALEFEIGQNVYALNLICTVNKTKGFVVKDIRVNNQVSVDIGLREIAHIYPENVEVLFE